MHHCVQPCCIFRAKTGHPGPEHPRYADYGGCRTGKIMPPETEQGEVSSLSVVIQTLNEQRDDVALLVTRPAMALFSPAAGSVGRTTQSTSSVATTTEKEVKR